MSGVKSISAAGVTALGLIISAWLLGWHFKESKVIENAHRNSIEVKGYAQKDIESDLAKWDCRIKSRNPELNNAYNQLNTYKNKTIEFLKEFGIEETDLELTTIRTREIYKPKADGYGETNQLEAYELSLYISYQSENIDKVQEISAKSSELINRGVNFTSFDPSFYYTKIDSLKLDMLARASKNAYQRAEKLAGNTGSVVGNLQSASQGVFQITKRNSTKVSDYGSFDTSSRLKTIKAVITAEFSVEKQ